jgi:ribonuclease HII
VTITAAVPTLDRERRLWSEGHTVVAGVDEVGRGPLAGPLLAAAVVLPPGCAADWLALLRDSKALPQRQREELARVIRDEAAAYSLGIIPAPAVDRLGIGEAGRRAMQQAVARLRLAPSYLLIDAFSVPALSLPQSAIIHGDALVASIAAASIVAKVERDRLMREMHELYPGYGFDQNKGYGTAAHLEALHRLGPSPVHRRSFAPVRDLLATV